MDQFPQMLYKAGGPEQIHGGNFSTLDVRNADEHAAALDAGWCETTTQALEAQQAAAAAAAAAAAVAAVAAVAAADAADAAAEAAKLAEQNAVNAAPTREQLEKQATDLGVEFSPNIGDKKLAERIAAKLAEQNAGA
jgi:hypothetical protein